MAALPSASASRLRRCQLGRPVEARRMRNRRTSNLRIWILRTVPQSETRLQVLLVRPYSIFARKCPNRARDPFTFPPRNVAQRFTHRTLPEGLDNANLLIY